MPATRTHRTKLYERDVMLWKPLPGYTSTFDDLLRAQSRWMDIFHETPWNPWRTEGLAAEQERAHSVMREWTRAEQDHRYMTKREMGAMQGAITRKHRAQYKADEARWEQDKDRYDPDREKARFALLERESIQASQTRELDAYRSGERFPSMPAERRDKEVTDLEAKLKFTKAEIERLSAVVGDREEVLDVDGRLPRDRRPGNLIWYGIRRRDNVLELQRSTAELRERIKGTKDRAEKSKLGAQLWSEGRTLQALLSVPILAAEDMCADCYTPQHQHLSGGDIYESRPCPRWPLHAARMEQVWQILCSARERTHPIERARTKPQPLATLPGNLPIAEVIERLSALHEEHPDAVVKRDRANRWELWPKEP